MQITGGNRATTWTRSLLAGLGALAMVAAITGTPQEARAQCGPGNLILHPLGASPTATGLALTICFGNAFIG